MNAQIAQIAQHLNITESAIVRVEEWAHVLFVVCKKLGARFVSKKVVKTMPVLRGSERQVDWANKIRENSIAKIEDYATKKAAGAPADKRDNYKLAIVEMLNYVAASQGDAKWWIDNRCVGGSYGEKTYNMVEPATLFLQAKQHEAKWHELCFAYNLV